MIRVNIHEAKTHLSRLLRQVATGEIVQLCHRNVPMAEVRRIDPAPTTRRQIGFDRGRLRIDARFFEALPESVLADFEGQPPESVVAEPSED